jgi:hypothetical protein
VAGATYSSSGVNLELYAEGMARLPAHMRRTQCPRVISAEGGFAALFQMDLPGLFRRGSSANNSPPGERPQRDESRAPVADAVTDAFTGPAQMNFEHLTHVHS